MVKVKNKKKREKHKTLKLFMILLLKDCNFEKFLHISFLSIKVNYR